MEQGFPPLATFCFIGLLLRLSPSPAYNQSMQSMCLQYAVHWKCVTVTVIRERQKSHVELDRIATVALTLGLRLLVE